MTSSDSFTCEACNGTFTKGWPDEVAAGEAYMLFGIREFDPQMHAVICDDCFKTLMERSGMREVVARIQEEPS